MSRNPIPLIAILLLCSLTSIAQKDTSFRLLLKTAVILPEKNISPLAIDEFNRKADRVGEKTFTIIQFNTIPDEAQRKQLQQAGIELLEYIPNNAYTVAVTGLLNVSVLQQLNARSVVNLQPAHKMHPALAGGVFPSWAVKVYGTVDVWISVPKTISSEEILQVLTERNFTIIPNAFLKYNIIGLRIAAHRLHELAALSFIEYVQPAPREDQPLVFMSRTNSKANILNASNAVGGRNLKGEGVVVGVGDNADPQTHVDFTNRLITRAAAAYNYHGTHVAGIIGSAGIRNELYTGYARKSTIISQVFSGVFVNAGAYVQDHGMVITNNSYGAIIGDCNYNGLYDLYSRVLDLQAFEYPSLINVFASGNSGFSNCAPFATGFRTVLGSYQSAKNVLTVGNAYGDGVLFPGSSKGPVQDGRIKPEIAATGSFIQSTVPPGSSYGNNTGTSMAAPAASGGLALLYQRYRQLNGGANPKSALMKALISNGGSEMGNEGPDFSSGFGWMNLLRSVEMLENNRYFNSTITNGTTRTHNIAVPANTAQLKVMLYWHDPAASVLAARTLVNDLDLEVANPSATVTLPRKLDTLPANVNNVAATGADHINNIEQVTINNPAAGNYTISVKGTAITQNPPQEYFVVYDFLPVTTTLTFPLGGETLIPGENVLITWDSYGDPQNTFTIQYSTNNGSSWTDLNANVGANVRFLLWVVPSVATDQARVRIVRNGSSMADTSLAFTIIAQPTVSLAPVQCEGYFSINWTSIAGATDYEVMMLRGDEMVSVTTTTANTYTFSGLSKDTVYWATVRPRVNGNPGRRAIAISRQPNNGTCAGSISDNDLKMDAKISPLSGRRFTSTELGAAVTLSVRIKNLDDAAVNNFNMMYSVNGGPWITENVVATVAGGATYTHNFTAPLNLSAVGVYNVSIVVKNTIADPVTRNDTLNVVIKQLDNQPINLGTAFLDNIETAPVQSHTTAQTGMPGLDRYDFTNSTIYGRIRSFVNTGIAYSGNRALTLDADRFYAPGNTNFLYGTFSLPAYNAATNDIRLDFRFKNHGQQSHANNAVWVRGSDTQSWIAAYDLDANQNDPGEYKLSSSIELGDLLAANGQNFTTSFQVRWGQWGQILAGDNETGNGYTFDDIRVYEVFDDIQMISIDTPVVSSCGLGTNVPVRVTVRNAANTTINNIPVFFRINGGSVVSETIASIAGNASVQYTFSATANLSALGNHTIQVWVDYPTDSYAANDTATSVITNSPVIATFPHLQNFESNNGSWYTGGKNSSWEYGTPSSNKIRTAASGAKAWKTRLTGNYNDHEKSYLYSPCYDITGMSNPTLSFSVALDLEDCGANLCDAAYIEYSADGVTWTRLGTNSTGVNWYNKNYGGNMLWSIENYTRWHVATHALPAGLNRLRLRFVVESDQYVNKEGIAIDDIHIYNNTMGIYDGVTMSAPVTQNINGGTAWIDFTSGGKLVASVQPNNQVLGNTGAQAYIHPGPVRNYNGQYYHNRNLTVKPANTLPADSVGVRFYFLDSETDSLIKATGCSTCTKPLHFPELGVSKYDDPDDAVENGTVADNAGGSWSFINSSRVAKVPFDKGYYAEFKVKNFSEFWLNDGGIDNNHALPVDLLSFTATKKNNNDVLLEWKTAAEFNVARFEVQVAKGNQQYQLNNFEKIGEVISPGPSAIGREYSFTDVENNKTGTRYYRLKIIDIDGNFRYSEVRPVVITGEFTWQVNPNPSNGLFNVVYQLNTNDRLGLQVFDVAGRIIHQSSDVATGFIQKFQVDLRSPKYAAGIYMVQVEGGGKKTAFKLIKQ